MTRKPTNIGPSVRARLLKLAHERGDDYQLVLTRFVNERLLYRVAQSQHGKRFVLKGAALFTLWTGRPHRATRDVDFLGFGEPSVAHVRTVFEEVLGEVVPDDGVVFDVGSLAVASIRENQAYRGVRVTLFALVTSARVRLQVDVGFGDAVTPAATMVDFPPLLDFPAPRLRAYPRETVVAEKLEAMVQLGLANSRMKDFHDLVVLARLFEFDGALLAEAIRATFERRGTPLPDEPPLALTSAFADDASKQRQWTAFVKKSSASDAADLPSTIAAIGRFANEPLARARTGEPWRQHWPPGGPWKGSVS